MKRLRRAGLYLLLGCLLAALAGQYCFSQWRDHFWEGVFFYGIAILCLIGLLTLRPPSEQKGTLPFWRQAWKELLVRPWRGWGLVAALVAAYTATRLNEDGLHLQAVILWLVGIVACLLAWVRLRQEPVAPPEPMEVVPSAGGPAVVPAPAANSSEGAGSGGAVTAQSMVPLQHLARWEIVALIGCTLLALLLRLVRLGTIPYVISGDEASMGLEAVKVLEGRLIDPFATGWLSHPTLYFFMLAGPVGLLGRNAWGLRLLSPLIGAATIPVLYLLARRLFDRRVALASMVLLTASHLHIHFSRLGVNNVYDPLFGLLAFLFLIRGLQEGRICDFALSGFFLGIAQFFYMGSRLLPIMVVVYLALWWLSRPESRGRLWLPATALGGSFLVTGAPLFYHFLRHPEEFGARLATVGIIQSGWLFQTEPLVTGKTPLQLLGDQLRKSILAFNYTLDPTSWYNANIPYLDFLSAILLALGLVVVLRHWRKQGPLLANVWFWLCLVFGGVLIENPPSSPRFVIFLPAVCLIAALGLVQVLDIAANLFNLRRAWATRILAVVLLVVVLLNTGFYFLQYTPSSVFGGLNTEVGMRVGKYLRGQKPGTHVYFFGPKRMSVHYATIPFLAPGMDLNDVEEPLTAPPAFVAPADDVLFIFLPERIGELSWVAQVYGGLRRDVCGHEGKVLFTVYEVRR